MSANSNSVFSLATFAAIAVFLVSLDEEATDDPFDFWLCESRLERLELRERPLPVSCLISIILSLIFRNVSECSRSKISNSSLLLSLHHNSLPVLHTTFR